MGLGPQLRESKAEEGLPSGILRSSYKGRPILTEQMNG